MPKSVTPVLSQVGYVSDIRDQTMALMRFMIMNPGGISSLWPTKLISFQKFASSSEQERGLLCRSIADQITTILNTKFSDEKINVNITSEIVEGTAQYRVLFDITMNNGERTIPLLISGRFLVDPKTYNITIEWNQSSDTASLITNS